MFRIIGCVSLILWFCLGSSVTTAQSLEEEKIASSEELQRMFTGNAALIIASRQTEAEILNYTKQFISNLSLDPTTDWFDIFLSNNGWFAVSIGFGPSSDCESQLSDYVAKRIVPDDSYCSTGQSFIAAFNVDETGLKPLIGRNYNVATAEQNTDRSYEPETGSLGVYRQSVAEVRAVINDGGLQAAYISEFSRKSIADEDFAEFAARFKDAFGPEAQLYAMQDAGGDFRLAFDYGKNCTSRAAFLGPPNLFSFGQFSCGTLQADYNQRGGEVDRFGAAYGLEFSSILKLSENNQTLTSELIVGNLMKNGNAVREQKTNYAVLTSLPVKDTLSDGLKIQSNGTLYTIDLASSGSELDEYICNQATINYPYWKGLVYGKVKEFGFSGKISSSTGQNYCLKKPLVTGKSYGDIVVVSREFLKSSPVPSEYKVVGEISSTEILDFFASLDRARTEKYSKREQRLKDQKYDAEDQYSALWLFFPPAGNGKFIELDICSTTADIELAKAYKNQLPAYFKEHIEYWSFSPNMSSSELKFNDRNIGAFANYDDAYDRLQQEAQVGFGRKYRDCDLFFGKSNIVKKIANRLPDWLPTQSVGDKQSYSTLLSSFALGETVSRENLEALVLESSGYQTAGELEFANLINAPSPSIVYGLFRMEIRDKSLFDQLVDDLYSVLGRRIEWSDVTSFTSKFDQYGNYQTALSVTKKEVEERIAAKKKAKEEKAKNYPFYALIQCQFQGNAMALAACFVDDLQTTVTLTAAGSKREVKYFNFSSIGNVNYNQTQLKIDLPARYSLSAQNASDALSINLEIRQTSNDAVVFQESQGQLYGVAMHTRY